MSWYDVGTVKVTVNSATVTGTGTKWLSGARQGEAFVAPDGRLYEVMNIASDTSLTLAKPYIGATATGQKYSLAPMQGYVKELADRAAELVPVLAEMGTAAKGTLATSTQDPAPGRVMRNGDWGFGGSTGVVGDKTILSNPINGIYRSGSSDVGKPVNQSGDAYIKFGWSGVYGTYLYGSPAADGLWYKNLNNGVDRGWKQIAHIGAFGLGRSGADANLDVFPAANLNALDIGSGTYYYNEAIGNVSALPFDSSVAGSTAGTLFHRQAGTAGGQIVVSSSNRLGWRGRRAGSYHTFREAMYVGEYGFGGAQVSPASWDAQRTGWYYRSGAKPAWGGGGFFLDLAYNSTAYNSGLRISTDPYTDNFYMNGAVSGQKTFRDACKLLHDKNIVGNLDLGAVIANGQNANGIWVRFADGTQICFQGPFESPWLDLQSGSLWQSPSRNWTYPTWFHSAASPVLFGSAQESDTPIWVVHGSTRHNTTGSYKVVSTIRWDVSLQIRLCAIGRWKA